MRQREKESRSRTIICLKSTSVMLLPIPFRLVAHFAEAEWGQQKRTVNNNFLRWWRHLRRLQEPLTRTQTRRERILMWLREIADRICVAFSVRSAPPPRTKTQPPNRSCFSFPSPPPSASYSFLSSFCCLSSNQIKMSGKSENFLRMNARQRWITAVADALHLFKLMMELDEKRVREGKKDKKNTNCSQTV